MCGNLIILKENIVRNESMNKKTQDLNKVVLIHRNRHPQPDTYFLSDNEGLKP